MNPTRAIASVGLVFPLVCAIGSSVASADVNYPNFNSVAGLTFKGVAAQSPGLGLEPNTISLTPPAGNSAGAVWSNIKQSVAEAFTTEFDFRIRDKMGQGADGLAFVIHNDSREVNAIGGRGGGIGFGTNVWFPTDPGPGIKSSIAIVFDSWDNTGDWATIPGTNIITAQMAPSPALANLPSSNFSLANAQATGSFSDGSIHHVKIVYTPLLGTGQLQVFYDNNPTAILTVQVELETQLGLSDGLAYVGFTAATGGVQNSQRHEILNWTFTQSQIPAPAAGATLALAGLLGLRRRRA